MFKCFVLIRCKLNFIQKKSMMHRTCYARLICCPWLPQALVKWMDGRGGRVAAADRGSCEKRCIRRQKEDPSLKYWWDRCLFCCSKEVRFSKVPQEKLVSHSVTLLHSLCMKCKRWMQRGELNVAFLKIYHPVTPSWPSAEECDVIQLTLPSHDTPLWRSCEMKDFNILMYF